MKDYDIIFIKVLYFLLNEAKISELDTRDWTELRNGFDKYIQRQADEEKLTKKYRVNLYYDTMYQVEVEAENEEEAVEKARELANDESNEYANEELLSGLCEEGHDVIEVK